MSNFESIKHIEKMGGNLLPFFSNLVPYFLVSVALNLGGTTQSKKTSLFYFKKTGSTFHATKK